MGESTDEFSSTRRPLSRATMLPPRCYTDPAFYALEAERIFRREWLSVGRVEQIPHPGDFFTVDLLDELLVVVRDQSDQVRVLSRVCRHRWMPVAQGAGNRLSFQCPYHLWTYGLDGRLLGAPEMQQAEDFDKAQCRLPAIRSEIWEGWIFVNFDAYATPLAAALEPLRRVIAAYGPAEFRVTTPLVFESSWNWKVMVENFMESYHHPGIHADTLQPIVPGNGTYADDSDGPYAILHNPTRDRVRLPAVLPIPEGLSAEQRSEFVVCAVFPMHLFAVSPDQMQYYQIEPHGAEHFTLRIFPCVPVDAVEDPAYAMAIDELRVFVDAIHQQDIVACTGVQAGLRSRSAGRGRYSHLEKALWQFHQFVLDRVLPA